MRSSGPHLVCSHMFIVVLLGYARERLGQNACCEKVTPLFFSVTSISSFTIVLSSGM